MRTKDYLLQIKSLDRKINNRLREAEELKQRALSLSSVRYDKDIVQGGKPKDVSDMVARWVDMENEITADIDRLVDLKHKIVGEINQLHDARHIELLMLRYVKCMTFEEIAVEMKYSFRQIIRIHGSALQEFDHVLECHIR